MSQRHVVVVGAGLAGLASARTLADAGVGVTVLERGERAGGRATHDTRDGVQMDAGAQLWTNRDRALLALCERAGRAERLLPLRPAVLAQLHDGSSLRRIDPSTLGGIARVPGVSPLDALRLMRLGRIERRFESLLDPERPEAATRLDDRSVGDFVRLYFGRSALARWAEPFLHAAALADCEETSRALFLRLHSEWRFAQQGVPRAGLGELIDALAEGCELRLGTPVESVEAGSGGALRVGLATPGAAPIEADAVVVATRAGAALGIAEPLLSTPEREFLGATRYVPSIVLHAVLERPVVPVLTRLRVPAVEGLPLASLTYEPGAPGARVPEGAAVVSLVARPAWSAAHLEAPGDVVEKALLGMLGGLHPGVVDTVRFTVLRRHREALPLSPVGRTRALARFLHVQTDQRSRGRRLYFAGDYLDDPTLEGATRSAHRTTTTLRNDFGDGLTSLT